MVDEAIFIVNDDGITFRGMDPSHVIVLDVTFPKSSFERLEGNTNLFGIRIDDLKNVISAIGPRDTIELNIENEDMMKISVEGSLNMEYNIQLIQKQKVDIPIPIIDYKAKLSIDSATLSKIISNVKRISEFIKINCNPERVEFSGKGVLGVAKINLDKQSTDLKKFDLSENSSAVYSLEYMVKIIRNIGKASKIVNLEYAKDNPMHLLFEMPSKARVEYYLAPRTSNKKLKKGSN